MVKQSDKSMATRRRLLDAALQVIRTQGYAATTVADLCKTAGVSKGSFFHHFSSKEDLALAAARHWSTMTDALFAGAAYQSVADPLEKVLAYIDFRAEILRGDLPAFTCLLGTMVQETFDQHPAIRDACEAGIRHHAEDVARNFEAAKERYCPDADWIAESLAMHTQAVLQGAFILAKATGGPAVAVDSVRHLRRYVELLFANP